MTAAVGAVGSAYTNVSGSVPTLSPGVPAGVVAGTLVCTKLAVLYAETSTPPTSASVTPPAGHAIGKQLSGADYGAAINFISDGFYIWEGWYFHYATGSESGTYAFSTNSVASTAAGAGWARSFIVTGTGFTAGNPYCDMLQSGSTGLGTSTVSSFTPETDGTLLLGAPSSTANFTGGTSGAPTGWAVDADDGYLAISHLLQTTAAATGALAFTNSGGDDTWTTIASIRTVPAGIAAVQAVNVLGTTTTISKAFPLAQTAGNAIYVVTQVIGTSTPTAPTDSKGNTYVQLGTTYSDGGSPGNKISVYLATNIAAATVGSNTVNSGGTGTGDKSMCILELSGVAHSSALDHANAGQTTSSSLTPTFATITTTAAGDVIIGGCLPFDVLSAHGGYSIATQETTTTGLGVFFQVVGSATTYTPTIAQATAGVISGIVVALKAASGGFTGSAAVAAGTTLTATGSGQRTGAASFIAGTSLTATGSPIEPAAPTYGAGTSLSAGGSGQRAGSAAVSAGTSLAAVGQAAETAPAAFTAATLLSATGQPETQGAAGTTAGTSLSATGSGGGAVSAAFSAGTAVSAVGQPAGSGAAAVAAGTTVAAVGSGQRSTTASFSAGTAIAAAGTPASNSPAAFSAGTALSIGGTPRIGQTASVAAGTSMSALGGGVGAAAFTAGTALAATASPAAHGSAGFGASTLVAAVGTAGRTDVAALSTGTVVSVQGAPHLLDGAALGAGTTLSAIGSSGQLGAASFFAATVLSATGRAGGQPRDITIAAMITGGDRWGVVITRGDRWSVHTVDGDRWATAITRAP